MAYLTQTMPSEYIVRVLDVNGVVLGDGPITTVEEMTIARNLDSIDQASFKLPASDIRNELIAPRWRYDLYDHGKFMGRFIHSEKSLTSRRTDARQTILAYNLLIELAETSVHFFRSYNNQPISTIINDLVSLADGWSAEVESGLGNETITYEGESILSAIDKLRERAGLHYRLKLTDNPADKIIQFGAFGDNSGIRVTNLPGQVQADILRQQNIAMVESLGLVEDAGVIYNKLIPLGFGQGVSQLNISGATSGTYTVQNGTNQDGSSYYYIADAASVAAYGTIEKILTFSQIRPISNSDANILNAQNALKIAAETFLARHKDPQTTYRTSAIKTSTGLTPGDKIRLVYRGVVDGYGYVDVNTDLWVLGIEYQRQPGGVRTENLTISTTDEGQLNDNNIMIDLVQDASQTKLHIPASLAYSPIGPYTRRINSANDALFIVRIKGEVTALNRSLLRFRTGTLVSSVTATASGGDHRHKVGNYVTTSGTPNKQNRYVVAGNSVGTNQFSVWMDKLTTDPDADLWTYSGSGSLSINIAYGLYADTVYPAGVTISINGIDRTAALGGPWGSTGSSTGDVELDITDYLVNAAGGVRQNHEIVFGCASGQGEVEVEVNNLVTIQPIAVT